MWKNIGKIAEQLVERQSVLLMLVGAVFIILAASKGVSYHDWFPIKDPEGRIAAAVGGLLIFAVGAFFSRRSPFEALNGRSYGVKILSPQKNDEVTMVNVIGEIKRKIPSGYSLMILRIYPDDGFIPLKEVDVDDDGVSWKASGCDIGGKSGDPRSLAAYLVGPSGKALFRYFREAAAVHNKMKVSFEKLSTEGAEFLPLIYEKTTDMVECAKVPLKRK